MAMELVFPLPWGKSRLDPLVHHELIHPSLFGQHKDTQEGEMDSPFFDLVTFCTVKNEKWKQYLTIHGQCHCKHYPLGLQSLLQPFAFVVLSKRDGHLVHVYIMFRIHCCNFQLNESHKFISHRFPFFMTSLGNMSTNTASKPCTVQKSHDNLILCMHCFLTNNSEIIEWG